MAPLLFWLCQTLALISLATSTSAQSAASLPKSITISYESLLPGKPSVKPLATIFYDPVSLKSTISSWTPPVDDTKSISSEPTSPQLLRILLPSGSSTLASLGAFNSSLTQNIDIHLSPDGSVFSASIAASTPEVPAKVTESKSKSKSKSKVQARKDTEANASVKVNIIPSKAGPAPKLASRKPPVVGADGKEQPTEEVEKSFFQKYWWAFMLVAVVAMAGGGDK